MSSLEEKILINEQEKLYLGKYSYNYYTGLFKMTVGVQLSSANSAPNSGNNHHLTFPFKGGTHSFKRQGACVSRN